MPIPYKVIPYYLTNPPSYTARPIALETLDYDALAEQINLHNPTIPADTARAVLEAFRDEVIRQLARGNTINLAGFMSFVTTLPVRLDQPTDDLPPNPVDVKAKPSVVLKQQVAQQAEYERLPYSEKTPDIGAAYDTNSNIADWIRPDYGFRLDGSNIGFDAADPTQGVFLTDAEDNVVQQAKISLNTPSKIIITPDFGEAAAVPPNVEKTIAVRSRYTKNGQVRIGEYSRHLRSTNVVTLEQPKLFVTGDNTDGPLVVSNYSGEQVMCRFEAVYRPDEQISLAVGPLDGQLGPEVIIPPTGTDMVLTGLDADVTVNFIDNTSYELFVASLLSYGRYMLEICDLSPIAPIIPH
ncbi:HU family DNA-binding protein [Candidatus Electrothrix sp.]|uniref:HU family DNA-binding protein n=1 Tax=Candidatus Electrothrix sp. TaxID=2170559 RepID=UPI0040565828